MNLLLIDGNNLAYRVAWTHRNLKHGDEPVSLLYGFLRNLIHLKEKYPNYAFIVAWDGGHERRLNESRIGVQNGIIKAEYKANRKKDPEEKPIEIEQMEQQKPKLYDLLNKVKVLQVRIEGVEADDIINTYVKQNSENEGNSIVITSDKDFYQCLYPGVTLLDSMNDRVYTREKFTEEFGFIPELWVDVGGLMGDDGDGIFGVPGWGIKTSCQYVKEYGGTDKIIEVIQSKSKRSKKEEVLLASLEVIKLAKSLKRMDIIPFLPKPKFDKKYNQKEIEDYMIHMGFTSIISGAWRLVQ